MPLSLPNLDDVTWEQLTEEARALIPAYAPEWTNHNPSDPGITLVELFAYFTDMYLYRINRIGDEQTLRFLRLLNGPAWIPAKPLDLEKEKRSVILALRKQLRAVTARDFEALAIATAEHPGSPKEDRVARAKCIPDRNLECEDAAAYNAAAPSHISVVVLPHHRRPPTKSLLRRVRQSLHAAKLLTTQVHVVPARFVTVSVHVSLVLGRDAYPDWVQSAAMNRLQDFFDPLRGGLDEKGWPFGRSVYVSEVYQMLARIPGVDYVTRRKDPRTGEEMDELSVGTVETDRLKFNDLHELEAIEVHDEELVALTLTPEDIALDTKVGRA
jgi:hypothetical protein